MSDLRQNWRRLRNWQSAVWLPVLPPVGALLELAALMAAIFICLWIVPGLELAELEPNPFWLPVLLLSLQYGTVGGLLAASVATAAYVLNGFPEQAIGENLFTYLLRIWSLPILWVGVALVLGQFRLRQIEVKQQLQRDLAQRTAEAKSLVDYSRELEARCRRLERQMVVADRYQPPRVLDRLAQLAAVEGDLGRRFAAACEVAFPDGQVSAFVSTAFGFTLAANYGWAEDAPWLREFNATHPISKAMLSDRQSLSILNASDEPALGDQGLAARAILAADRSGIVGFIKVEKAQSPLIDAGICDRLDVLGRLLAPHLGEAQFAVAKKVREAKVDAGETSSADKGRRHRPWRADAPALPSAEAESNAVGHKLSVSNPGHRS